MFFRQSEKNGHTKGGGGVQQNWYTRTAAKEKRKLGASLKGASTYGRASTEKEQNGGTN